MKDYPAAFRLDGKVALVTGGARGIGAEIAAALAQAGAHVLITDVLDDAGCAMAARISSAGGQAQFMRQDVTDEAQWERAVSAALDRCGGLDVLVNNAGIETAALLTQCTAEDFRRVMEVNVTGVFFGLKHGVRAMQPGGRGGRGGSIVNLSSIAGLIGSTAHIAYHASKGAVRSMTKAAAIECAQLATGIRVNSVHPGIVSTDMGDDFVSHIVALGLAPDVPTASAAFQAAHPLGFGRAEDVACAVLYLATDASKWTTGSELVVDGGYTAA